MEPICVRSSGYIELEKIIDDRDGNLCVIEECRDIPFKIRRVYFINHLENHISARGQHAHKTLQQVIFCIQGSFTLKLDDGTTQQDIIMDRDNIGIILGVGLWHTMTQFSSGCVLLILASDFYDADDYIRDYNTFLQVTKNIS